MMTDDGSIWLKWQGVGRERQYCEEGELMREEGGRRWAVEVKVGKIQIARDA